MNKSGITLLLIGATGLVGRTMLIVLEETDVPVAGLIPIASADSRGKTVDYAGRSWTVDSLEDSTWKDAQAALLSAGSGIARRWVPILAEAGITCIDNSSAFRGDENIPLVVPEVNGSIIKHDDRIIANPNCSTIQLAVVLAPLHEAFGLEEVIVSTYQSASGAGQKGRNALSEEATGNQSEQSPFPHQLYDNLIPAIGSCGDNGFFQEEMKLVHETRRILNLPDLKVFPAVVRVPVPYCHGEAVHLKFKSEIEPDLARELLASQKGIIVLDDPDDNFYPTPIECAGKDEVFVGRIRQMPGEKQSLDIWIVADNLRKGAALNAVQILQRLVDEEYLEL